MKSRNAVRNCPRVALSGIALFAIGVAAGPGNLAASAASICRKVVLAGEVNAGQSWQAPLGQGWVFRLLPVPPGQAGYSGWDLVVDRDRPAGYPDALLLATLPYNSINEREIGTTFGLRAQDAVGWNPRSFHFMIDPAAFREAQQLFLNMAKDKQLDAIAVKGTSQNVDRLFGLEKSTAAGELHIEDVKLRLGVADAAPFAQGWALAAMRAPHETVPADEGKSTPRGSLIWMRFSLILWLPAAWKLPADIDGPLVPCER